MKLSLFTLLLGLQNIPAHANIEQGIIAFDNGNLPLSQKIFSQENDTSYEKYLYLAKIASANGKPDDAEKYINEAIELSPQNASLRFISADILAKQAEAGNVFSVMGYIKKVKKAFTAAVELAPNNIEYRRVLIQFHINAPSLLGGDIDEALKHAKVLKKLDVLSGTSALIQVYGQMENTEKFNEVLQVALIEFADEPEFFFQLGIFYQQQEHYDAALTYFRNAANMASATDEQRQAKYSAIFQLGRTSILSDSNFSEGEKALTQYLNEAIISADMPTKNWAKFRLANIVEAKGEKSAAVKLYNELVGDAADKELQKQLVKRIKNLS
mgnify:CR=1 FL=1